MISAQRLALYATALGATAVVAFDQSNLTLGAVTAAPPSWPLPIHNKTWDGVKYDLSATVDYGVELIHEAASNGAALLVFPECWFPGYPKGYDLNNWMVEHSGDYIDNALVVNSTEWNSLVNATATAGIYVALGFTERIGDNIYMGQALLDPAGATLIHRHKLRPSGSERDLWSDGVVSGLQVVNTTIGRLGLLECWEHLHPTMTFNMLAQTEDIHIGPWPYNQNVGSNTTLVWEDAEVALSAHRIYSLSSGTINVMGSVGYGAIIQGPYILADSDSTKVATQNSTLSGIIYTSVNGSTFSNVSYNANSEQSWAALQEINEGFPSYIPHLPGTLIPRRNISIDSLKEYASTNGTSKLVGTPSNETSSYEAEIDSTSAALSATSANIAAASSTSTSGAGLLETSSTGLFVATVVGVAFAALA